MMLFRWNAVLVRLIKSPPKITTKNALNFSSGISRNTFGIIVEEKDVKETFVRGSGPGGQKINKSKNNVQLVHLPTGISVQCQEARDLTSNRKHARKLLKDKIDFEMNGAESKLGRRHEKIRKQKRTAAR